MDHGFLQHRHGLHCTYNKDPDGRGRIRIRHTTVLPYAGVELRCYAVIDCTPSEERMPPVTIDILNKNLPPPGEVSPQGDGAPPPAAEAPQAVARFTCSSGDFVVSSQLRQVEEAVAAAGLPLECARIVNKFCRQSAGSVSNTFFTSVTITVEAKVDEDEVVPDGAATEDCAICYMVYVVGGATSVKLPCGHVYHHKCLARWALMNATCPYCRAPLPVGETSGYEDNRSQPCWTWALIGGAARFVLGFVSNLARRPGRVF